MWYIISIILNTKIYSILRSLLINKNLKYDQRQIGRWLQGYNPWVIFKSNNFSYFGYLHITDHIRKWL